MPYRHSVWIDVFGIVLFGLVLLGGAGYLLSNMGTITGGSGGGGAVTASGGGTSPAPQVRSGLRTHRSVPASRSPSNFGGETTSDDGSGATVPFSDSWRSEATPDLTGPVGPAGTGPGGAMSSGTTADGPSESDGPSIASRRSPGGPEGSSARTRSEGGTWRSEAQQFSGQVQALSSQLQQMERNRERSATAGEASSSSRASSTAAGEGTASTSSGPGTPDDPDQVPIGGLGWLLATGLGYGAYRLRTSSSS